MNAQNPLQHPIDISLSSAAAKRILELATNKAVLPRLRVLVKGGGCSGFQYEFSLSSGVGETDHIIARDGAEVVIDDLSVPFLQGSEIDFVEAIAGSEFQVHNPNAKSKCGCGISFSL